VKLFPRPDVQVPWASVVRGDERVHVDSSSSRINGSKEFDWVLTPRIVGELDIPPIRYSYFNPDQRRYAAAEAVATRVRVVTGALAASDTARVDDLLSIRPRYQGPVRTPLHQHFGFWLLVAAAPIPAFGFRSRERRRRVVSTESPADRLRRIALPSAVEQPTPPVVRRAFGDALGARLGLAPTVFTRPGALARALRRSGVSREVAERCEGLMRELDGAAYSRDGALSIDAAQRAIALYRAADDEALPHDEIRLPLSALGILLVFGLSTGVLAAASQVIPANFDAGVSSYGHRDYASARDAFREVTRVEPRAADAWANYGTAAWAAGDTAHAVAGWQRALRLEPLASDVRERVQLAHGVPVGSAGFVPPTPLSLVAVLGVALWLVGWAYATRRAVRGQTLSGPASSLLIAGAITLIATFGLESQLAGKRVAVVRATTQLHDEPMLGSGRGASTLIGEVVRIKGIRGAWTLIGLDDGRDGWIDSSTLISLDQQESSGD
jgi:hypothetical protein